MDNYTTPPSQTNPGNAIAVPIFGILSTILMAVPFKLLVRSKNMPACALILLIGFTNIMGSVNAILWPNEAKMLAYNGAGLCDIEVYFRTPLFTAEATALCCLTRDLARAVDSDNPRLFESRAMRRRRLLLDCLFVFGPSIIQLPMNFIVQSNRYGLIPVYGCLDMMDSSWPRVVFMILWPLVFSAINAYYAWLVIYRLRKHRGHLSATLSSTGSGLDTHKFIKLFLVAISVLVINLPFSAYFFYTDLPSPMVSFTWARVHNPATWYQIAYFQTSDSNQVQYNPWGSIAYGAVVFLVYGFTNDAINVYRRYIGKAGLARWWPELLEDRVLTRRSASNGSSTGTARWATRFDVVSKTVSYLDGSRKYSQATSTIVPSSDGSQSRKGSMMQHNGVEVGLSDIRCQNSYIPEDPDIITQIALPTRHSNQLGTSNQYPHVQYPEPAIYSNVPPNTYTNALSSFRTHLNLTFPLFHFSTRQNAPRYISSQINTNFRPDTQWQRYPTTTSSQHTFAPNPKAVSTNIWSVSSTAHPCSPTGRVHAQIDEDLKIDPISPEMGTRSYRERERKQTESRKSGSHERGGARVIADDVRVDMEFRVESSRA